MKKYLFIVLLVGACFGQDVYPYFSDMAKQLEFEKNKIVISKEEVNNRLYQEVEVFLIGCLSLMIKSRDI